MKQEFIPCKSETSKCKKYVTKHQYEIYIKIILKSAINMHRHNASSPTGKIWDI